MLRKSKFVQLVVLALLVVLAMVLSACQEKHESPSSPSTALTTIPSTTAAADLFTKDDLMAIMDEAAEICETGSYVIENPNEFILHFFNDSNNHHVLRHAEILKERITLSFDPNKIYESKSILQFGIFLDLICSRYPGTFCDADYSYSFLTNRMKFCSIFFAPDYKAYGYASPLDLYKAFEKNEAVARNDCFEIYYNYSQVIELWSAYNGQNTSYKIYDGD